MLFQFNTKQDAIFIPSHLYSFLIDFNLFSKTATNKIINYFIQLLCCRYISCFQLPLRWLMKWMKFYLLTLPVRNCRHRELPVFHDWPSHGESCIEKLVPGVRQTGKAPVAAICSCVLTAVSRGMCIFPQLWQCRDVQQENWLRHSTQHSLHNFCSGWWSCWIQWPWERYAFSIATPPWLVPILSPGNVETTNFLLEKKKQSHILKFCRKTSFLSWKCSFLFWKSLAKGTMVIRRRGNVIH